jgi:hypothetical protein
LYLVLLHNICGIFRALFDCLTTKQYNGAMRDMKPVSLRFRDSALEKKFLSRKDSTFKFYVASAFAIYLFIMVVQLILLSG